MGDRENGRLREELAPGDPQEEQAQHEEDMVGSFRDDVAETEPQVEGQLARPWEVI